MVHVTKLYPTQDATVFHAFGRVICGTCELLLRGQEREGERGGGEERE